MEKPNKLKIVRRDRKLTDEEAAKYKKIREEIEKDLPDLIEQAKVAFKKIETNDSEDNKI